MIGREEMVAFAVALVLVALATVVLHDRHYRRRREIVREARLRALEEALPEGLRGKLLERRLDAHEQILLEDETT